eukprot:TRINITY_DN2226_c1_g1_i3.p1 TRINITY_DN2226_c1_g1~~TRINITY_DN2226_c1_g1_i3.p1  ORF type:complete len:234 (-),score=65.07 TRINITY_DN2226_c1_g1_i3:324-1025(-)
MGRSKREKKLRETRKLNNHLLEHDSEAFQNKLDEFVKDVSHLDQQRVVTRTKVEEELVPIQEERRAYDVLLSSLGNCDKDFRSRLRKRKVETVDVQYKRQKTGDSSIQQDGKKEKQRGNDLDGESSSAKDRAEVEEISEEVEQNLVCGQEDEDEEWLQVKEKYKNQSQHKALRKRKALESTDYNESEKDLEVEEDEKISITESEKEGDTYRIHYDQQLTNELLNQSAGTVFHP